MKIIVLLLSSLIISSCYAKDLARTILNADELNLKNFGFSYCLSKTKDHPLNSEASLAMGGYFQSGSYEEPAYKNLKKYINDNISEKKDVYKNTAHSAILMHCLTIYNSSEYTEIIKQQKGYVIP